MNSSEFRYEFGAFRLDASRREVVSSAGGHALDLKARTFDTLLFFVEHPGELLDKTTLMKAIWPDTVVEENNLNQHIFALRRALAQSDGANPYIVTVPRRGYQFVAAVRVVTSAREAASSADLPAQQLYVQGRALAARPSESNLRMAISLFQEATTRDPGFANALSASAIAHAGLAGMAYEFESAVARAQHDAERALAIDPSLAEAHSALAFAAACRCRWLDADAHFKSAISLDPANALSRTWYTTCVTASAGHMQQALQQHLEAYRLGPGEAATLVVMAFLHLQFGRDADALKCIDVASGLGFAGIALPIPFIRAQVEQRRGRYAEAAHQMQQFFACVTRVPQANALVELVYGALAGRCRKDEAAAAIRAMTLSSEVAVINPVRFARPLLQWASALGDLDLAYDITGAVLQDFRRSGIVRISIGFAAQLWLPEMLAFRQDERFQSLVTGLGLMDYWAQRGPPDHCELHRGRLICR